MKNTIHEIYRSKVNEIQSRIPISLTRKKNNNTIPFSEVLDSQMSNLNYSPSSNNNFDDFINNAAKKYKLSPAIIKSIIKVESNFNPQALSKAGAQGLMQLMPNTAKILNVENVWNPEENIEGGSKYLRQLLDQFDNNLSLSLAAYNAGPGNVNRYGGIPPFTETQNYVKKVLENLNQYKDI